jgi:hypothetical protein
MFVVIGAPLPPPPLPQLPLLVKLFLRDTAIKDRAPFFFFFMSRAHLRVSSSGLVCRISGRGRLLWQIKIRDRPSLHSLQDNLFCTRLRFNMSYATSMVSVFFSLSRVRLIPCFHHYYNLNSIS